MSRTKVTWNFSLPSMFKYQLQCTLNKKNSSGTTRCPKFINIIILNTSNFNSYITMTIILLEKGFDNIRTTPLYKYRSKHTNDILQQLTMSLI